MKAQIILTSLLVLALPCIAGPQDRACLIEGSYTFMGQRIDAKDCMQSPDGAGEGRFKKECESLANAAVAFGGPPGKITYLPQCPTPAQGTCRHFLNGPYDAYYYARKGADLAKLPAACARGGGVWSPAR